MKRKNDLGALGSLSVLKAKPEGPDNRQYLMVEITARQLLEKTSEVEQFHLEMQIKCLGAKSDQYQSIFY